MRLPIPEGASLVGTLPPSALGPPSATIRRSYAAVASAVADILAQWYPRDENMLMKHVSALLAMRRFDHKVGVSDQGVPLLGRCLLLDPSVPVKHYDQFALGHPPNQFLILEFVQEVKHLVKIDRFGPSLGRVV